MSVALRSMVTAIGGASMLVLTSPRLAGYAGLVIPLVILPIALAGRRQQKLARANQGSHCRCRGDRQRNTECGSTPCRPMRASQSRTARYDGAIARALATARRRIGQRAGLTALVILLIFGAITLALWSGARAVMAGTLDGRRARPVRLVRGDFGRFGRRTHRSVE